MDPLVLGMILQYGSQLLGAGIEAYMAWNITEEAVNRYKTTGEPPTKQDLNRLRDEILARSEEIQGA